MKIIISNLAEGEHLYEFSEDAETFELGDFIIKDNVAVSVRMIKSNSQVYADVKFRCRFEFPCDRCLENFEKDISGSFIVVFKYSRDPDELKSGDDENIFFIPPEKNFIDLSGMVRENILVSIPMRKAPDEKDGRCAYCGKTEEEILRNTETKEINPVWDKLLNKKNLK